MENNKYKKDSHIKTSINLRLDHIQILVNKSAPEIELLRDKGFFISDVVNKHPGFGTSGRVIYFDNFYIELIWIEDENVFRNLILPLYRNSKKSLTQLKIVAVMYNENIINSNLPFKTKNYSWEWMNPGSFLKMVEIENELTPLYLILPHSLAFSTDKKRREFIKPLTNHGNKISRLNKVKVVFKDREMKGVEKYLEQLGILVYQSGKGNYIELVFDENKNGKKINLIKELSLIIKY